MSRIQQIAGMAAVREALAALHEPRALEDILAKAIAIQQIPAPTFAEEERAAFVETCFRNLGLRDVRRDMNQNVFGLFPGTDSTAAPVVVSAHTDTVFPAGTDLTVKRSGTRVYGPGIADNSLGVASLLILPQLMLDFKLRPARDIWFVANVAEEGLGDLHGMRTVVDTFGRDACYIVVEGGSFGHIIHRAIGVNRFRLSVTAEGGHSWADFGHTSAIHALGRIIARIDGLEVPRQPKTTYNVGMIEGGRSINTIAEEASLLLDLRSEDSGELEALVQQAQAIAAEFDARPRLCITMTQIGNRPAGAISQGASLVRWAAEALQLMGCLRPEFGASSTDANIPLSKGYEAVCVGLTHSGNVHRHDEYLDTRPLARGVGQLLLLGLAAAEFE